MKKTWKKTLSVFLTLSMVTALAPATAWAEGEGGTEPALEDAADLTTGTDLEEEESEVDADVANQIMTFSAEEENVAQAETANVAEIDGTKYATLEAAINDVKAGESANITLLANSDNTPRLFVSGKNITIDLNNYDITFNEGAFFYMANTGGTLTLTGEGIVQEGTPYFGPVVVKGSPQGDPVAEVNIEKDVTLKGWAGLFIDGNKDKVTGEQKNEGIVVNVKGTLEGQYDGSNAGYGLYVNGTITTTKKPPEITLDGATLNSEDGGYGMYLAGNTNTTITNSTITGDNVGIEIRAGKLTIENSTVTGGSGVPTSEPNDNGTTTSNTALAVPQHTTELPIEVIVKSGTFEGGAAIYESNPQGNEIADDKVKINIADGDFTGMVKSDDCKNFINGGEYSESVDAEYLAEDLYYEAKNDDDMFTYHSTIGEAQEAGSEVTQVKTEDGTPVDPEATKYTVTINNNNGDDVQTLEVASGTVVKTSELATPARSRYNFRGWAVNGEYVDEITVTDNVEIVAAWKKKSSSSSSSSGGSSSSEEKTYAVSKADVDNGEVKIDPAKAEKGDKVTITVTPDQGYEIDKVRVTDADGNKIDLNDKGNGEYTFTMPDSKVEVKATFEKADEKAEETPVAPEEVKTIVLTINQLAVSVFGETTINDVAPIIRNDRTMLPIRVVAEALGATVAWDDAQNKVTITKDELVIEIFIGSPFAKVNGTPVQLDSPAFIENSRTYLPIRFVAENLGADVAWDQATQQVTITPNK